MAIKSNPINAVIFENWWLGFLGSGRQSGNVREKEKSVITTIKEEMTCWRSHNFLLLLLNLFLGKFKKSFFIDKRSKFHSSYATKKFFFFFFGYKTLISLCFISGLVAQLQSPKVWMRTNWFYIWDQLRCFSS